MGNRTKTAVVIGAGPAGMEAALKIGQAGFRAVLIEKEAELGGNVDDHAFPSSNHVR